MKTITLALSFLLLVTTAAHAQEESLNFEYGSTLYRNSRPSDPPGGEVLQERLKPFYHGVASGDPLADRVIIWTRVTPETYDGEPIEVTWVVARDTELKQSVKTGSFTTTAERDYTVKIDVTGLAAGTTYYYGFTALGANSLTGRTKTTPTAANVDQLKFGVVSCSNYQAGYFNAYGHLAARNDLDAVLHLGDYIYETANPGVATDSIINERPVDPAIEVVNLFEYRARYSTYRLDTQLMHVHQQHPLIAVWDDHEYANNSYTDGAAGHQPNREGDWQARKAAARQAYIEWLPIRDPQGGSIYRRLSYGNLVDLFMLDTRIEAREMQIENVLDPALQAADRTLLGAPQKTWLKDQLRQSTARWKLIGQQVMFSPFNIGWAGVAIDRTYSQTESMFLDTWAGYPAERNEMIDFLEDNDIEDVVILTGSFHSSVAYEVTKTPTLISFISLPGFDSIPRYRASPSYDPATAAGAVAVEFLTPSITSANFDETVGKGPAEQLSAQINQPLIPTPGVNLGNPNPHMKYVDLLSHGYFLLDVGPQRVQADYYYSNILEAGAPERFDVGLTNQHGTHQLGRAAAPAAPKRVQDRPAPADPPRMSTEVRSPSGLRLLSVYPNPVTDRLYVQYGLQSAGDTRLRVLDAAGRQIGTPRTERQSAGLYTYDLYVRALPAGVYFLEITGAGGRVVQAFVR
ncbi:alkaline phosphatase D family protein [Neolewinella litorea]|uniref:T9SS type A sorting domain-containing protein n=1 Tax=Neolewinella litorea TaxID=2562452 RepID=A0A4S4NHC0_9BACT|nr:alkaline phosphatase D family protein [Neolewinella litorea]THH35490.1 T9SS type A sorting domain-containing protein [Neolewinella litorea]